MITILHQCNSLQNPVGIYVFQGVGVLLGTCSTYIDYFQTDTDKMVNM